MIEDGFKVVIVHGNGPQVESNLLKVEAASDIFLPYPLDYYGSETQGSLGYLIQQGLYNKMNQRGIKKNVVTLISQVVVDQNDPAFNNPTKPIGPFYTKARAELIKEEKDVVMVEDSGRGYRQVVPSSKPLEVVEVDAIKKLVAAEIGADYLIVLTGVEQVSINFGKPNQQALPEITIDQAKTFLKEGHLSPGSMGPKTEAAIIFS